MSDPRIPRIVLDTNVLLVSISSRSRFHWIFEALLAGRYTLCITNEILHEYEEILAGKWSPEVAKDVIRALLLLPNVARGEVYFQWRLITTDPDDDKFVDCAVAANALAIVTEDGDFDVLKKVAFPAVRAIGIEEFRTLLASVSR